ncbi:testis-expressed protein 10 homolog [Dendroctonus ponderosae]|uniref:testis-expressed protein 10 homolog n=1 Tax=Dendroctonus ponderosae TaxID=77166 RepID=UPI0020361845|nr:testis-expressed protein 10 homolog [Dendroctonus ponderosae]KAH1018196.1 hypothetical protein HUJ05_006009 [Dendroctonus ponderosae]
MGRNQQHKKHIRAEKAKTKLKQPKTTFLPKGQNVTDTSFKVRPIVLQEQLKQKDSNDILSRRNLNVKDLLSRLKHHNGTVRRTACAELCELIKIRTEDIIQRHLSPICLAISGMIQDPDTKIRKTALKTVEAILDNVPSVRLSPFFHYFTLNLRCAMTDINRNIQEDSLLFLDCFIRKGGGPMEKAAEEMLPDFLALVSKLRNDSEIGRTLTLNLGSKLTSVEWRIKVLSRLQAIFRIILVAKAPPPCEPAPIFSVDRQPYFGLYKTKLMDQLDGPDFGIYSHKSPQPDLIKKHLMIVVPLLFESWLEGRPEQEATTGKRTWLGERSEQTALTGSCVLTQEAGALLACITNTLHSLWQYVKIPDSPYAFDMNTVFLGPEGRKFLSHLLSNFPYSYSGARSRVSKSEWNVMEHNNDPNCVRENLLICFVYLMLYVNCTEKNLAKEMAIIMPYLKKIMLHQRQLKEESSACLLDLLSECFGKNYRKWQRSGMDLSALLEDVVAFYRRDKVLSEPNKLRLSQILANDIFDNPLLNKSASYHHWLTTLPDILCQTPVPKASIETIHRLFQKNCQPLQEAFHKKLPDILANLDNIQMATPEDLDAARRTLSYTIYYMPSYSQEEHSMLQQFIDSSTTSLGKYIRESMQQR